MLQKSCKKKQLIWKVHIPYQQNQSVAFSSQLVMEDMDITTQQLFKYIFHRHDTHSPQKKISTLWSKAADVILPFQPSIDLHPVFYGQKSHSLSWFKVRWCVFTCSWLPPRMQLLKEYVAWIVVKSKSVKMWIDLKKLLPCSNLP